LIKPRDRAAIYIAQMLGNLQLVSLVRVDDECCGNSEFFERVPELHGLGWRTFDITLANIHQGRSFDLLDEFNRRGGSINLRLIVGGPAEVRKQPLVDTILPVVARPVCETGRGHSHFEPRRLSDGPHREIAPITMAGYPHTSIVDRRNPFDSVDAGKNVPQFSFSECHQD
jgi:hypothetical protein